MNLQNKLHKNYKRQGNYVKVGRHLKKTFINTKCKLIHKLSFLHLSNLKI